MSHHMGCPKRSNLYADCECAAIDQREHTEQLRRFNDSEEEKIFALETENTRLTGLAETLSQNVADLQQAMKDVLPSGMQEAVMERLDAIQSAREQR